MISGRYIDKSSWGEGPWQDEDDWIAWINPDAPNHHNLVIRHSNLGHLCGYVGVDERSQWYQRHPGPQIDVVHGGITLSGFSRGPENSPGAFRVTNGANLQEIWWFGFDCGHAADYFPAQATPWLNLGATPAMVNVMTGNPENYKTVDYVVDQIDSLREALLLPT